MVCFQKTNEVAAVPVVESRDLDPVVAVDVQDHGRDLVRDTDVDPDLVQNVLDPKNVEESHLHGEEAALAVVIVLGHDLDDQDHVDQDLDLEIVEKDLYGVEVVLTLVVNVLNRNLDVPDLNQNLGHLNLDILRNTRIKIKIEIRINLIMVRKVMGIRVIRKRVKRNQVRKKNQRKNQSQTKRIELHPKIMKIRIRNPYLKLSNSNKHLFLFSDDFVNFNLYNKT